VADPERKPIMTQPGATPAADPQGTATVPAADSDPEARLAAEVDQPEEGDDPAGAEHLGEAGKKAIDRMKAERNAAKSELAEALKKLKEYEDKDKSDLERAQESAAAAQKRAEAAEQNLLRQEVAATKGLTAAQARRLVGTTREELEADADDIRAAFTGGKPAAPKPDPSQGSKGEQKQRSTSLTEAVGRAIKDQVAPAPTR
jgi:hypothetical protein